MKPCVEKLNAREWVCSPAKHRELVHQPKPKWGLFSLLSQCIMDREARDGLRHGDAQSVRSKRSHYAGEDQIVGG